MRFTTVGSIRYFSYFSKMDNQDDENTYGSENSQDVVESQQQAPKKKRARIIAHEWTEHEINELIQAVETKPELWKSSHESYKNRNKKDAAWRDIEENVFDSDIKLAEITTKWNNLRVQYKTYAVKYKTKPSGSGRGIINKWKHFDAMNFIGANEESSTETTVSNLPPVVGQRKEDYLRLLLRFLNFLKIIGYSYGQRINKLICPICSIRASTDTNAVHFFSYT